MRKIILNLAVSLDGFIEGPHGEYDWCFTDEDYGMTDFFKRIDAVFLGRKSYELVLRTGDSYLGKMKRYVFSNTLKEDRNPLTAIVSGDITNAVKQIKSENGKDIWLFGGAQLVTSFINEGLIDEFMLAIHPILLGSGKPLFQSIRNRIKLQLFNSKIYDSGLVQLFYKIEN